METARMAARFIAAMMLLFAAVSAQAQSWAGDWRGTLATAGGPLRLMISIREGPDGALSGDLESVDQAPGYKTALSSVTIDGGRLSFAVPSIGASYQGQWEDEGERFSGTFDQGGGLPLAFERGRFPAQVKIAGLDGIWNGSVDRNGVSMRLNLRITTAAGGTAAALIAPDMAVQPLVVTGLAREGREVSFAIPGGNVWFKGTLAADGASIEGDWVRAGLADARVTFRKGVAGASAAPARPQLPRAPFPYRSEQVKFANPRAPGVMLAGTLTLPEGRGPFPTAILITGSGAQDRNESMFGHKPFLVLADHLTRAGIAVLRYDDRGTAASTGSFAGSTSADFASDANAAFAFLAGRPEIDSRAIGLIGHSEGGMIAPLAARDNRKLAYLVLLAGPGTDTRTLLDAQRRAIGGTQGLGKADLERGAPVEKNLYAIAAGEGSRAEVEKEMRAVLSDPLIDSIGMLPAQREATIAQLTDPWFRYFVRYDPAPVLRKIKVPVLALAGSLDRQVVQPENIDGIRTALRRNRDVTATVLPGLNHLFQTAKTGGLGEYDEIEETFAPQAMDMIAEWIRARFPDKG